MSTPSPTLSTSQRFETFSSLPQFLSNSLPRTAASMKEKFSSRVSSAATVASRRMLAPVATLQKEKPIISLQCKEQNNCMRRILEKLPKEPVMKLFRDSSDDDEEMEDLDEKRKFLDVKTKSGRWVRKEITEQPEEEKVFFIGQRKARLSESQRRVEALRTDDEARAEFFRHSQQLIVKRRERWKELGCRDMRLVNMSKARCSTPEVNAQRLKEAADVLQERVQHAKEVRNELKTSKVQRFYEAEERRKRRWEEFKYHTSENLVDRQLSWYTILPATNFLQVIISNIKMHEKEKADAEEVLEKRRMDILKHSHVIIRLQMWWRRARIIANAKHRREGVDMIKAFIQGMNRTKVQFAVAMHTLIQAIVMVQRHYRAVKVARKLRRDQAMRLFTVHVKNELAVVEGQIAKIGKKKRIAETKFKAAVKARKPIFEAEVNATQKEMEEMMFERLGYMCMSEKEKMDIVHIPVEVKEIAYGNLMFQFGKKLHDKYLAQVNEDLCYAKKRHEYFEELANGNTKAIPPSYRRIDRLKFRDYFKPSGLVSMTSEEAKELFISEGKAQAGKAAYAEIEIRSRARALINSAPQTEEVDEESSSDEETN